MVSIDNKYDMNGFENSLGFQIKNRSLAFSYFLKMINQIRYYRCEQKFMIPTGVYLLKKIPFSPSRAAESRLTTSLLPIALLSPFDIRVTASRVDLRRQTWQLH